jgi:hypothetical protein
MPVTQSAYEWLRSHAATRPRPYDGMRGGEARDEIERLRDEIEECVTSSSNGARDAIGDALGAVSRLQVATANYDACNPPKGTRLEKALVTFADRRLSGHADAIERGMTYTADNTMRLLRGE